MNVVNMDDINKKQQDAEKQHLLKTFDEVRERIENGEIVAYTISSIRSDDEIEITACVKDRLDAIGLLEASKMILFSNGSQAN